MYREWENDPRWQELEGKTQCSFPLCHNARAGALLSCMDHHDAWIRERDKAGASGVTLEWPDYCLAAHSTMTKCADCQTTFFTNEPDYLCPLCRNGQERLFRDD